MSYERRLAMRIIEADTCASCHFLLECDDHEKVCYQKTKAKINFLKQLKANNPSPDYQYCKMKGWLVV